TAALSLTQSEFIIDGDEAMRERPIGPLVDALKALGIGIQYTGEAGFPPLKLQGGAFSDSTTTLDGSLSSQYLTALLMALPLAPQDTTVRIEGDLVSLPYIDMTLAVLDRFGIEIEHDDYRLFRIRGNQMLKSPGQVLVEGDASSASYFLAAAAISGEVTVKGVGTASLQGDVAFADVVEAMGARVARQADQISVRASGSLKAIDVDLNHIPDAAMTLATLALFAEGTTRIRNIYNWRIKETDRMTAMATELRKVGATITTTEDSITITPPAELKPAQIATYGDHRMAMCFSLLAMSSAPPVIENPEVTAKTFPDYWEALASVAH
ncbi:MAG: 3-phosphoshikimate 1-carboxyvinyltransferase, partial [Gammaproteobacteria bacterium]